MMSHRKSAVKEVRKKKLLLLIKIILDNCSLSVAQCISMILETALFQLAYLP
jgi:uncharacterized protein YlaN (UPF0358 family)